MPVSAINGYEIKTGQASCLLVSLTQENALLKSGELLTKMPNYQIY